VGLLFVVALLNYMDRLLITSMHDPIRAAIPMSDGRFGLLTSVFLWVYAAASPAGGFVADRAGRRGVIIASLFFWSAATFATGFAHSFAQLLTARALMGLSEACYLPAALALISDFHPGPTRSLATGVHMVGLYVGAALGGLGGFLAQHFGWAGAFRLLGIIGVAYGIVLWIGLRDADKSPTLDQPEIEQEEESPIAHALRGLLTSRAFLFLLAVNVLVGVVNWVIYGWLPTYLGERFKLGLGAAGMSATGYIQAASFAGVLIAGAASDRWSRSNSAARAIVPAVAFVLAGPALMLCASTGFLVIAIGGLIVYGLARGAFDANQMPLLREIADQRFSATGYGLFNLVSTTAGDVMVYAAGAMRDSGVNLSHNFQICGGGFMLAGVLLWLARPRELVRNARTFSMSSESAKM